MRYLFADFALDTGQHRLTQAGAVISLEPQVFDLLVLFLENAGELVTKDQLIAVIWQGRIVSESAISARINAARRALGDTGKKQAFIKTVSRRGFQFVADVKVEQANAQAPTKSPEQKVERQTIEYAQSKDGTQIALAQIGSGPPLMRAGHWMTHLNLDQQSSVWQPLLHKLSRDFRLCRYDQRGTGLSDWDLNGTDIQDFSDDLAAVANKAGLDKFPIFATSQGVPVALHFAATQPKRVTRLVLYGGYAQGAAIRDPNAAANISDALLTLIKNGWGKNQSAFMKSMTALFMPTATQDQLESIVSIQNASATPEVAAKLRRAIDRFDVLDLLPQIKAPTLVVHASGDAIHPIRQGKILASHIPNAQFLQVESDNHVPLAHEESWQVFMNAAVDFLSEP